jgi:acetamidase/formamidase
LATHYFPEDRVHYLWDREGEPATEVEPGDSVVYRTREVSDGQITRDSTAAAIESLDWARVYPLAGPLAVRDGEPGDTLEIEVVDIHTEGWGWTAIIPGTGLLPEDFPDAYLKVFDLSAGDHTYFNDDIVLSIDPFLGTMGVCPDVPDKPMIMPPGKFGGNLDTRHLTRGSRLFLPVECPGALFSCGDAHAAQGDGEVCVTGIESPTYSVLRFELHKGHEIPSPQFQTPGELTPFAEGAGWYATTGIGPDLMQASKDAVRAMIGHLGREHDLSPAEAYVLCSLAVDLKISEVVDQPNWVVSAYLPLSIFV